VDPLSELSQLLERLRELVRGDRDVLLGLVRRVADLRLREPQADRQRNQPLLGAVVQVPLQPAPLGVARLDDPQPRGRQLLACLGARDRERDQLGELPQTTLRLPRQDLSLWSAAISAPQVSPATLIGTPTLDRKPRLRTSFALSPERSA
jgi:hypothetical protein